MSLFLNYPARIKNQVKEERKTKTKQWREIFDYYLDKNSIIKEKEKERRKEKNNYQKVTAVSITGHMNERQKWRI